jgi:hypothetical protein
MSANRNLVEKEFAILLRGTVRKPDYEVDRIKAFSAEHAVYLAKERGHTNIAQPVRKSFYNWHQSVILRQ